MVNRAAAERLSKPLDDLAHAGLLGRSDVGVRLIGARCEDCGQLMIGRRYVCSACMSAKVVDAELSPVGSVYSWTVLHVFPGREGPTPVAYVDLDDGVRTFARLSDRSAAAIGARVRLAAVGDDWWFETDLAEDAVASVGSGN